MKSLILFFLLISCGSTDKKQAMTNQKSSGKLVKIQDPIKNTNFDDFYTQSLSALNPALFDETLDRYNTSELSAINSPADPLLSISLFCQKGNFAEAFQLSSEIYIKYRRLPSYWNQIANCHLLNNSLRKSLLFYNKALELNPDYVPALNNLGVLYSRSGQDQKALIAFEKAYNKSKFSKTPRFNLARLYLNYGLFDLAIPIIQGLLNNSSEDVGLLNAMATAYLLKNDLQRSLFYYQKIPRSEWQRPEIGLNISMALKLSGRSDDAISIFKMINEPSSEKLKEYYIKIKKLIGVV